MAANKKTVVIIGLGYAGLSLAKLLDADGSVHVIGIDVRENFMLHKWGALRAAVAGGEVWKKRVLIPTDGKGMFKNTRIIQDRVVSIKEEEKCVLLEKGEQISYDVLVIASGARNFSPGEPPIDITSREGTLEFFQKTGERLREAKHIMVAGSGPVAVELCGELRTYLKKDVLITLAMESELLSNVEPPLTKKGKESLLKLLASAKIKVLDRVTVASPEVKKKKIIIIINK